jgi:acylphosphatase
MVRARIFAEGSVQGVGFRATAAEVARELGLEGLVRNLRDGRVEIFLEGSKEAISEFLVRVMEHEGALRGLRPRVDNLSVVYEGEPGFEEAWRPYSGFEVDYWSY